MPPEFATLSDTMDMTAQPQLPVNDRRQRRLHDLRISVTDRCNFRCHYCMPKDVYNRTHKFLSRKELLSYEEIVRVAQQFVALGVKKIRLTGGEPLLRSDLESLIEQLASINGVDDIGVTTNASLLSATRARSLRAAGTHRINISLDALDNETFASVNCVDFPVTKVLNGIDNALDADFDTVKVNMVVQKGVNENSIVPMVEHFRDTPVILRFIEFMDVGNANQWQLEHVYTAAQIRDLIQTRFPIQPLDPNYSGEVAERWSFTDGAGEIGIISSISQPFCNDCTRARLSAIGEVYNCLFASEGHDLRASLREGISDDTLRKTIAAIWQARDDQYSMERFSETRSNAVKVEMSYIGG